MTNNDGPRMILHEFKYPKIRYKAVRRDSLLFHEQAKSGNKSKTNVYLETFKFRTLKHRSDMPKESEEPRSTDHKFNLYQN